MMKDRTLTNLDILQWSSIIALLIWNGILLWWTYKTIDFIKEVYESEYGEDDEDPISTMDIVKQIHKRTYRKRF